jgi:prepilin-type N-terminal cleavage/methylation domain-containing protein
MRRRFPSFSRGAFTLIELLATITIISVLLAIFLPVVGQMRMRADEAKASSNLRQIAIGFNLYATDNNNFYPPSRDPVGWIQWTKAVYPYIYPDAPPATNEDIADPAKVFISPRANPVKHTGGRLSESAMKNGNIVGYGYNARLPVVGPFPTAYGHNHRRNLMLVERPASTALLMDCYNFSASPGGIWIEEGSRRWDGHVFVAYCSGNVAKLPFEEIPLTDASPEGKPFWSGLP